jgi:Uma2 family endonuclease
VWVVDPDARTVTVFRSLTNVYTLGPGVELTGDKVIPGLAVRVRELFD